MSCFPYLITLKFNFIKFSNNLIIYFQVYQIKTRDKKNSSIKLKLIIAVIFSCNRRKPQNNLWTPSPSMPCGCACAVAVERMGRSGTQRCVLTTFLLIFCLRLGSSLFVHVAEGEQRCFIQHMTEKIELIGEFHPEISGGESSAVRNES